jgi:hypothetical protein
MSETVLKILLNELKTLRIVCKCKTAIEISVPSLVREKGKERAMICPGCGIELRVGRADPNHGPLADGLDCLADAWTKLAQMPNVEVQFVVPAKD